MPLWVYDIETDEDCALMQLQVYGAYVRLLSRQWIEGSVPPDTARLAALLRVTEDYFAREIWPSLAGKFPEDGRGRRQNHRLAQERDRVLGKIEVLKSNGAKGGRPPTKGLSKTKPKGFIRASESGDCVCSSGEGGCKGETPAPTGFAAFWAAYPRCDRKTGKSQCQRHWISKGLDAITDRVLAALDLSKQSAQWRKDGGEFIPLPLTWLHRTPWETDPEDLVPDGNHVPQAKSLSQDDIDRIREIERRLEGAAA